jgi:Ca2+-binding EF-hand superfamily protein
MTRLVGLVALLAAFGALLGSASAGDDKKKERNIDAIFRRLDKNNDGRLSKDEFLKMADRFRDKDRARAQLGQTYDRLDPKNDGLTRDQFRTFVEACLKKKAEK